MYVENLDEVLSFMIESLNDYEEVHYVADANTTILLLGEIATSTDFIPESITFDSDSEDMYYYTTLSKDEEGNVSYLVYEAIDEYNEFYGMLGLILVDEDIPECFEKDVINISHITNSPVRVHFGSDCDGHCDCCEYNKSDDRNVEIDLDEETDQLLGFNIDWNEYGNSYSFSYHSSDEDAVLDMMEMFNI